MIRSDAELKRWWDGLTKQDRVALLTTVGENARTPSLRETALRVAMQVQVGSTPDTKDLEKLRKWWRE